MEERRVRERSAVEWSGVEWRDNGSGEPRECSVVGVMRSVPRCACMCSVRVCAVCVECSVWSCIDPTRSTAVHCLLSPLTLAPD